MRPVKCWKCFHCRKASSANQAPHELIAPAAHIAAQDIQATAKQLIEINGGLDALLAGDRARLQAVVQQLDVSSQLTLKAVRAVWMNAQLWRFWCTGQCIYKRIAAHLMEPAPFLPISVLSMSVLT